MNCREDIRMAQYNVNNISIDSLLTWIREGEVAIPEMQRPFVWDAPKVRDLIDSLYTGFPVGYIIVWKNPNVRLKDGSVSQGKKILIDGQQRITALQAALTGMPVIKSNYQKKRIQIAFNPQTEQFEVSNPAIQNSTAWIPDIAPLFQTGFNTYSFIKSYCDKNSADPDLIGSIINKLQNIENNNIGEIELSSQLTIEQVTEIFIRINSKGVVLSQADFAMSKISSDEQHNGNRIRKTIDYFCHLMQTPRDYDSIVKNDPEFAKSYEFSHIQWILNEKDDIYTPNYADVIRVAFTFKFLRGRLSDLVNLLSGRDFETRNYQENIMEESFQKLYDGVLEFTNQTNFQRYLMIIKSADLISPSLIRSQNVLNFGYALFLLLRIEKQSPSLIEKIVRRWIILCLLTGRYSGSPESQFDFDIKRFHSMPPMEFLLQIEAGDLSEAFWNNTLIGKLNTSVASSPIFKVFLMSQVKSKNKGFLSEHIDVEFLIQQHGDIHHIFPKKYLQSHGMNDRTVYNQIANYAYTQTEINIQIKDKAPKEYMKEVRNQCTGGIQKYGGIHSQEQLLDNLKDNCIPTDIFEMDYTHYDTFLKERRKLIAQKIRTYYDSLK